MNHLKSFNENNNISYEYNLKLILNNIYNMFDYNEILTELFEGNKLNTYVDVHESFIDLKELIELTDKDLMIFASNLGITDKKDILIKVYKKLYYDKYNRSITNDINLYVSDLNKYINNKTISIYLIELKKIQEILNKK